MRFQSVFFNTFANKCQQFCVRFNNLDQYRMIEIISHLTKMRFGEEEHNKMKDTKEVSMGSSGKA